ncbi:MAG TPA: hypothetical protein VI877_01965 [Dehalococcoidia bacterium]|nr:hypothetical protein [Dehalococcoidia bacterium]
MLDDLALEAANMKRHLEQMRAEIEEEPLDRFKIGGALSEIFLSYEKMKAYMLLAWDSYVRSLPSQDLLAVYTEILGNALGRDPLDAELSARLKKVTDARFYITKPEHYDDRTMKRVLYDLINTTDSWLALLDKAIFQPRSKPPGQEQAPGPG